MHTIPRTCAAASLAVLCLTLPAAGWSQDSQDIALPVNRLPAAEQQSASGSTRTDGKPAEEPTLIERVAELRQHVERLARRLDKQTNRSDRRLAEQAQRITQLEQKVAHLHNRLQRPRAPADEQATAAAQARTTNAAQAGRTGHSAGTADTAETTDTEASADSAESDDAGAAGQSTCSSALDDRFLFDVFFQASTDGELASAADTVQAIDLRDWFILPNLRRLYVGRYGTCHLAERRQADIHARTGLALTIDAVEDTDDNADAAAHEADTVATESAPFFIVGVEFRGTQAYLGVARTAPHDLADITWLQPGQAYDGWRLHAIRTQRGIATFAVHGRAVNVRLSQ